MDIWIGRNGERHGPYKEADVRQWLRSGEAGGDDLGWHEGLADWQRLAELFPDALERAPDVPPPMAAPPMPDASASATLDDYAGFWKRVVAYLIDALVLYIPSSIVQRMMGGVEAQARFEQARLAAGQDLDAAMAALHQYYVDAMPAVLVMTVVTWLYFALLESSSWQGTIGKRVLGIRVTDMHGARISLPRALGRYPAKYLSTLIFCIGFLMVAWTRQKQGLHDLVAGTLVLNGRADPGRQPGRADDAGPGGSFSA